MCGVLLMAIRYNKGGMHMNSKSFNSHKKALTFARKLKENGQLDIQIWELPATYGNKIFIVLWKEK